MELMAPTDLDLSETETTIGGLVAAASIYLESAQDDETKRAIAWVARALATVYAEVGLRKRAGMFALEYLGTTPDSDRDLMAIAYGVAYLAAAGDLEKLHELVRKHDPDEYPDPLRSILVILAQRAGYRDRTAGELAQAARAIAYVPTDLRLQCVLFAANALVRLDAAEVAAEIVTELRADLVGRPLSDARVVQVLGQIAALTGDLDGALRYHQLSWTRYDDVRYLAGATIRRAIEGELVRSRRGALAAAAGQGDWCRLLELIESCRLQASYDVVGSGAELDEVAATGEYKEPSLPEAPYFIDVDALPAAFQVAVGDTFDRADVTGQADVYVGGVSSLAAARAADGLTAARPRLDSEEVMRQRVRPEDLWWSSWHEHGVVYWVLSQGGAPGARRSKAPVVHLLRSGARADPVAHPARGRTDQPGDALGGALRVAVRSVPDDSQPTGRSGRPAYHHPRRAPAAADLRLLPWGNHPARPPGPDAPRCPRAD
jgi:hypothetical protein